MGRKKEGDVADHATPEEVEAAIADLGEADLLRLERFSQFRAGSLRVLGLGWSADDLLQEALVRTFEGRRNWKRGITLVKHLIQTMRSISSHLPDELKGERPIAIDAQATQGQTVGATLVLDRSGPEDVLGASETLSAIAERFAADDDVGLLIEALADGMKGPEVREAFGWSEREYETVMRRLRRGANREEEWRP